MDVNADLLAQLQKARALRESVVAEWEQRKREIETQYAARLRGLDKAVEGLAEALGGQAGPSPAALRQPPPPPPSPPPPPPPPQQPQQARTVGREVGVVTIADSILRDLKHAAGHGISTEELTNRGLARGFMQDAKKPQESVRSIIYGLIDKGEPIMRIAPKTWAYRPAPAAEPSAPPAAEQAPYPRGAVVPSTSLAQLGIALAERRGSV